jgi:hypothetical protein
MICDAVHGWHFDVRRDDILPGGCAGIALIE